MAGVLAAASVAVVALGASEAPAATLGQYDFETSTYAPSASAGNTTVSNMVNGPGMDPSYPQFGNYDGLGDTEVLFRFPVGASDVATSLANGNTFAFSITPDAGYQLNLTGVSFEARKAPNLDTLVLQYDPENDGTFVDVMTATGFPTSGALALYSQGLSDTGIQNSVAFRLVPTYNGVVRGIIDNVTVEGSVELIPSAAPIPEPATAVGMVLAVAALASRGARRLRRR
jgi:hypothetical protein